MTPESDDTLARTIIARIYQYGDEPSPEWVEHCIVTGLRTPSVQRVHNHAPYRPNCNEREVDGQLRGACLNDDGNDR